MEEIEVWKDIIGYEKIYQISNFGRVKRLKRFVNHTKGVLKLKEKILRCEFHKSGYIRCHLRKNGVVKKVFVHRIVAYHFIENTNNKPFVNHKDCNKRNNNISNLEWCTDIENKKHAYENNIMYKSSGTNHYMCKLSFHKIQAIRRLNNINPKFNVQRLALKLNVHKTTIRNIITGRTHKSTITLSNENKN